MAEFKSIALPIPAHLRPLPAISIRLALPPDAEKAICRELRPALDYAKSNPQGADTPDRNLPEAATIARRFIADWTHDRGRVESLADRAARISGLSAREYQELVETLHCNRAAIGQIRSLLPDSTAWRVLIGQRTQIQAQQELETTRDALDFLKVFLSTSLSAVKKQRGRPSATVKSEVTLAVARWWQRQRWDLYYRPRKGAKPGSVFMALVSATVRLLVPKDPISLSGRTIKSLLERARADPFDTRPRTFPAPRASKK